MGRAIHIQYHLITVTFFNLITAGPEVWGRNINPTCDCRRQSPINIMNRDVKFGANFSIEFIFEHAEVEGKLENNGKYP